jgi:hypothetical protein
LATKLGVKPCSLAFGAGSLYMTERTVLRQLNPATDVLTAIAGVGLPGIAPDGTRATADQLSNARGLSIDHFGNPVLAEAGGNKVRVVAARPARSTARR